MHLAIGTALLCGLTFFAPATAQVRRPAAAKQRPVLDRFQRMTPAERKKALEKLPPERRRAIQNRLQDYDRMSEDERSRLSRRLENFEQLPPERQEAVRRSFRRLNNLPAARRKALRAELLHLQQLSGEDRRDRMAGDDFREKFNPAEREILEALASVGP